VVISWVGFVLFLVYWTYLGSFPHCRVGVSAVAVLEQLVPIVRLHSAGISKPSHGTY